MVKYVLWRLFGHPKPQIIRQELIYKLILRNQGGGGETDPQTYRMHKHLFTEGWAKPGIQMCEDS